MAADGGGVYDDIDNWFSYHRPMGSQVERYQAIREEFKSLAITIANMAPPCADRTVALRKLRETCMAVNQAIACNEKHEDPEAA
jgi:hypothetical protein